MPADDDYFAFGVKFVWYCLESWRLSMTRNDYDCNMYSLKFQFTSLYFKNVTFTDLASVLYFEMKAEIRFQRIKVRIATKMY